MAYGIARNVKYNSKFAGKATSILGAGGASVYAALRGLNSIGTEETPTYQDGVPTGGGRDGRGKDANGVRTDSTITTVDDENVVDSLNNVVAQADSLHTAPADSTRVDSAGVGTQEGNQVTRQDSTKTPDTKQAAEISVDQGNQDKTGQGGQGTGVNNGNQGRGNGNDKRGKTGNGTRTGTGGNTRRGGNTQGRGGRRRTGTQNQEVTRDTPGNNANNNNGTEGNTETGVSETPVRIVEIELPEDPEPTQAPTTMDRVLQEAKDKINNDFQNYYNDNKQRRQKIVQAMYGDLESALADNDMQFRLRRLRKLKEKELRGEELSRREKRRFGRLYNRFVD